jgi:hypothetical protein
MAGPAERDHLVMLRALGNVADAHVTEPERELVTGMLKDQLHPLPATRAVGVFDRLGEDTGTQLGG